MSSSRRGATASANGASVALAVMIAVLLAFGVGSVAVRSAGDRSAKRAAPDASRPSSKEQSPEPSVLPPGFAPPPQESRLPHVPEAQRPPLEELMAQVAQLRGLEWKEPLDLRVVPRQEMVRRLRLVDARDSDPAQLAAEEMTLKLLGLIPPGLDYSRLLDELASGVVLGFYDPETKELYVGAGDVTDLTGAEKASIVHEMTHALTDQHFAYGLRTVALDKADKADEYRALIALLEGDARLTEYLWMERHLSEIDALAVLLGVGVDASEGLDVLSRTPPYVRRSLFFPYEVGLEFVERIHSAGGFAAVDAAYRDPPVSTEHVLHPEAYSARESATPPALPDLPSGTGCALVRAGTLGEFDMRAILENHGETDASGAARGWNGDSYALVRCGGSLALAERWQTDPGTDPRSLAEALGRWSRAWSGGQGPTADGSFSGPAGAGRIVDTSGRVDLVIARDATVADRVAAALS